VVIICYMIRFLAENDHAQLQSHRLILYHLLLIA
jgi:hypothetical protein